MARDREDWEALTIGNGVGHVGRHSLQPGRVGNTAPALDDRMVILGNLQTLLTEAIAELTPGTG